MRTPQQDRRTNPYPWTWELPVAAIAAVVLLMVLVAHLARAAANLVAGAGPTLTPREGLFSALPGLLSGDAAAGLSPAPPDVAGPGLLWSTTAVAEAVVLAALAWALVRVMRRWGPTRMRGMAAPDEAEELLGVSRLRRNAAVIRPDLYGPPRAAGRLVRLDERGRS